MLAFKIEVEGQPPVIAGVEDWSILALHVTASRGRGTDEGSDDIDYSVGGLTTSNEENISHHFRWPRCPLSVGSSVTVTLVETETTTPPTKRYRSDKEVQENPYTEEEMREMRRQDYLALKKDSMAKQAPNPSIERTSQGLRPCAASHLKR